MFFKYTKKQGENYHPWDLIQKSVVMTEVIITHRVREPVPEEKLLLLL